MPHLPPRPRPRHGPDRGTTTAEYSVGTLGAVLMGAVLYKLGVLGLDSPWFEDLHDVIERALSWRRLVDHVPSFRVPIFRLRL